MGKVATLIYYCPKCDAYFGSVGNCPVCNTELKEKAVINVYELQQLMAKLQTPQGIVNLLESFSGWIER